MTGNNNSKVFGVIVHHTDCLEIDFQVVHPIVKVLMVDLESGQLIRKSDESKSVVAYYEEASVTQILPLMTQPYSLKDSKTVLPRWEELLLYNEQFDHFQSFQDNLGIFFIIQDFKRNDKMPFRDNVGSLFQPAYPRHPV